ncbi:hypothetical protein SAMN06264364_12061 [Quadrisphaera granulorum]|uniref:Uncharacterized protein n=1 Tax=Quadrisphaera granulorum TaxID=317664 RepID=A0A316A2G4_9ACTN|nr:hypothetical protein BXY45_12061 [Quadrisphaera granulorum]SZE97730.1 hypothetical protein SAMN06264364_12061 [Quadrisphaera granulorum]
METEQKKPVPVGAGRTSGKQWAAWMAGTLAFPVAGLAGRALSGPVDGVGPALIGGLVTGAVIGTAQGALSPRLPLLPWAAATAAGVSAGLAAGSAAVGYGTSLGELATMGAITGVVTGAAQAVALGGRLPGWRRLAWPVATSGIFAAGWTVTTLFGIDVERQYTTFGATGALVATALTGLLVQTLPAGTSTAEVERNAR